MIVVVGPFPPPTHGMAVINSRVYGNLVDRDGTNISQINTAPPNVGGITARKLLRPFLVLGKVGSLIAKAGRVSCIYCSISGGLGQVYELSILLLARLLGARLVLHHHSYHYLYHKSWLTQLLCIAAGPKALHVTQSQGMSARLNELYRTTDTLSVSNAGIIELDLCSGSTRPSLLRVGYLSNISEAKGVFDFLEVARHFVHAAPDLQFVLAGPFDTKGVEAAVMRELNTLPNTQYVGPLYGDAKADFLERVDAFLFPTRYHNETEGIVNFEAMMHAAPVIAYGRGCIPEIISPEAGVVVDVNEEFLPAAAKALQYWLDNPTEYQKASAAARQNFLVLQNQNKERLAELIDYIVVNKSADYA